MSLYRDDPQSFSIIMHCVVNNSDTRVYGDINVMVVGRVVSSGVDTLSLSAPVAQFTF